MKPLLLQLLLFCLALKSVPGNIKERLKKYILDPPPCKSAPENCAQVCIYHKDCQVGLECCSSFCGIVCSRKKKPTSKR
ncbi:WAP four-disulfide core domain protein 13 [Loxodonta africana]|nr:WAP four-disulfide core domain protein 13 [Loxodonta africana]